MSNQKQEQVIYFSPSPLKGVEMFFFFLSFFTFVSGAVSILCHLEIDTYSRSSIQKICHLVWSRNYRTDGFTIPHSQSRSFSLGPAKSIEPNRTKFQSNPIKPNPAIWIELDSWIEFDWVRKSNEIEHTENKEKSIEPKPTFDFRTRDLCKTGGSEFDSVRQSNEIELTDKKRSIEPK